MKRSQIVVIMACVILMVPAVYISAQAQPSPAVMLQIPPLQICNGFYVEGKAKVVIRNAGNTGEFGVKIKAKCHTEFPIGDVAMYWKRPEGAKGKMTSIHIHQLTFTGKLAPLMFVSGICDVPGKTRFRFWIMIADESAASSDSRDVICFVIVDGKGHTVGHGAGPVKEGDIKIWW